MGSPFPEPKPALEDHDAVGRQVMSTGAHLREQFPLAAPGLEERPPVGPEQFLGHELHHLRLAVGDDDIV